jgi:hypothetical protein
MNMRRRDARLRAYVKPNSRRRTRKGRRASAKVRLKLITLLLRQGLRTEKASELSPSERAITYYPRCSLCGRDRVCPTGRLTAYEECPSCGELLVPLEETGHRFHPEL